MEHHAGNLCPEETRHVQKSVAFFTPFPSGVSTPGVPAFSTDRERERGGGGSSIRKDDYTGCRTTSEDPRTNAFSAHKGG